MSAEKKQSGWRAHCQQRHGVFALAVGLGTALGVAFDKLALGVALGVVIGLVLDKRKSSQ